MKAHSTRVFKLIAWFYLLFPLTYLGLVVPLFDLPTDSLISLITTTSFILTSLLAMVCGMGLREMKRWSWYALCLLTGCALLETISVSHQFGASQQKPLGVAICWSIFLIFFNKVSSEIRVPYYFPRIRWWESNPRFKLSVPVRFWKGPSPDRLWEGDILAISVDGCFIKFREPINEGDEIHLRFRIFSLDVEAEGRVLWVTESGVTHPKGIGVKFITISRKQRRVLRLVGSRMRKISALFRKFRYLLSPDDFVKKLNDLENQWVMGSRRSGGR